MLHRRSAVLEFARGLDAERLHPHLGELEEPAAVGVQCFCGHHAYPLRELAVDEVGLLLCRPLDQGHLFLGGTSLGGKARDVGGQAAACDQVPDHGADEGAKYEPGKKRDRVHVTQWSQPQVTVGRVTRQGRKDCSARGLAPRQSCRLRRLPRVSLSIGIAGLPNVGKSTVFNALTRAEALASNYPFATIEPNVGVVGVPDPRLPELARLYNSARIVPATVRFVDIAGLVRGASRGQGLGNQFLAHIREADAICQVVRVFADPDVAHVDGDVSPERDIETVVTELILADLQTLEKALPRLAKETKFAKDAERARVAQTAEAAEKLLYTGVTLWAGAAAAGIDL